VFLDALAEQRRADGLPATSVAWGVWAGAGFAEDAVRAEQTRREGMIAMTPSLAVTALAGVDEPALVVADVDWQRVAQRFTGRLLAALPEAKVETAPVSARTGLVERLAAAAEAERHGLLLDVVRRIPLRVGLWLCR